jgi:hypothetical protein
VSDICIHISDSRSGNQHPLGHACPRLHDDLDGAAEQHGESHEPVD